MCVCVHIVSSTYTKFKLFSLAIRLSAKIIPEMLFQGFILEHNDYYMSNEYTFIRGSLPDTECRYIFSEYVNLYLSYKIFIGEEI